MHLQNWNSTCFRFRNYLFKIFSIWFVLLLPSLFAVLMQLSTMHNGPVDRWNSWLCLVQHLIIRRKILNRVAPLPPAGNLKWNDPHYSLLKCIWSFLNVPLDNGVPCLSSINPPVAIPFQHIVSGRQEPHDAHIGRRWLGTHLDSITTPTCCPLLHGDE